MTKEIKPKSPKSSFDFILRLCRVAFGRQPLHTCHISGPWPHPGRDEERRDLGGGQERPHHFTGPGEIKIKITQNLSQI